jgi:hypothetical protein
VLIVLLLRKGSSGRHLKSVVVTTEVALSGDLAGWPFLAALNLTLRGRADHVTAVVIDDLNQASADGVDGQFVRHAAPLHG